MIKYLIFLCLFAFHSTSYAALAGGRPNAVSEGQNAFAGVINPANAVWLKDRIDVGAFYVHQKSSLNNPENNPRFSLGKTDLTYRTKNLFTADIAIHKQYDLKIFSKSYESSFSIAFYTTPSVLKLGTKKPIPIAGTTPMINRNKTQVISAVFSFKLNKNQSVGFTVDYFYFSHRRNGFQNSDNLLRSVSPGNVTNNGDDHSHGLGVSVGWRWNITKKLTFGATFAKKSYCGQYQKYRGYEPHHAKNYIPQLFGAGFNYRFTEKIAGRLELLWSNLGNLPGANNNILPDGSLNLNKRGSKKSPGPGLNDATYINLGVGYAYNPTLSVGAGYSHRIKSPRRSSNFLSHTYRIQTIYDILSFGANVKYQKHNLFFGFSYGFKNKTSGFMPIELGGGRIKSEKQNTSLSMSWGYLY